MSDSQAGTCSVASESLVQQFQERRPIYEQFTPRLKALLEELLDAAGIRYHLIEARTKDVASVAEKVCRPGKSYHESIDEIPDLVGVRIIAYYLDDLERIKDLIRTQFAVDLSQSADKRDLLEENEFGYLSIHFVATLAPPRVQQMEWKRFAGLRAEIQVRTVLQHAWAAISHALQYKAKRDIPKSLRRQLFRLCGIFELADEQFLSLKQAHDALSAVIDNKIAADSLDIEVTAETLASYIDHTGVDGQFSYLVDALGWDLVAFCHGNRMEDFSDLRAICELTGISSIQEFHDVFSEIADVGDTYLMALAEASPGPWSVSPLFILELLLLVHRGTIVNLGALLERADWDKSTAETVLEVAKERHRLAD